MNQDIFSEIARMREEVIALRARVAELEDWTLVVDAEIICNCGNCGVVLYVDGNSLELEKEDSFFSFVLPDDIRLMRCRSQAAPDSDRSPEVATATRSEPGATPA